MAKVWDRLAARGRREGQVPENVNMTARSVRTEASGRVWVDGINHILQASRVSAPRDIRGEMMRKDSRAYPEFSTARWAFIAALLEPGSLYGSLTRLEVGEHLSILRHYESLRGGLTKPRREASDFLTSRYSDELIAIYERCRGCK